MKQKAVFFDRDGTLIQEKHYLSNPDDVHLFEGAGRALKKLQDHGYQLFIVTNQSGIGRGYYSEADFWAVQDRLNTLYAADGVVFTDTYFCPHTPDEDCNCRKPKPGMLEDAIRQYNLDPTSAYMVGDKDCDVLAGQALGIKSILVLTGYGKDFVNDSTLVPDHCAAGLMEAASFILGT